MATPNDAAVITAALSWLQEPPINASPPEVRVLTANHVEAASLKTVFRWAHGVLTVWWNDSLNELGIYYDDASDMSRVHRLYLDDFVAGATDRAWTLEELGDKSKTLLELSAALSDILRGFRDGLFSGSIEEFHRVITAGEMRRKDLDSGL